MSSCEKRWRENAVSQSNARKLLQTTADVAKRCLIAIGETLDKTCVSQERFVTSLIIAFNLADILNHRPQFHTKSREIRPRPVP